MGWLGERRTVRGPHKVAIRALIERAPKSDPADARALTAAGGFGYTGVAWRAAASRQEGRSLVCL